MDNAAAGSAPHPLKKICCLSGGSGCGLERVDTSWVLSPYVDLVLAALAAATKRLLLLGLPRRCCAQSFELRHHGFSKSTRAAACPPRRFSLPKKVCQRCRLTERLHRRSSTTMCWTACSAQFPQRRRPRRNARPSSFFGRPAAFRTHAVTTLRPKRFGEKGVRSGSIFFKTIYCFKGVGGTASSVVHHCSFYDGA